VSWKKWKTGDIHDRLFLLNDIQETGMISIGVAQRLDSIYFSVVNPAETGRIARHGIAMIFTGRRHFRH